MGKRERRQLYQDERYTIGLGCVNCEDLHVCGGLNVPGLFSCRELCCGNPGLCDFVCPRDTSEFVVHVNSIGGFDLNDLPRVQAIQPAPLPLHIPLIYHNSMNRQRAIDSDAVAISLFQLIDFSSGEPRCKSPDELCVKFGVPEYARIVVSGTADDLPLEKYYHSRNGRFLESLARLNISLVTSPNFSSFVNAPRWNDLYNLKRIGICWTELVAAGIPASLHLNGRTSFDWQRLTEWVADRDEVRSIAFEFATLDDSRKPLYVDRLLRLAQATPRRLQLVLRGGVRYLGRLAGEFDIVYLDTEPFIKANHRQRAVGRHDWVSVASPNMLEIDQLLDHNVRQRANRILRDIFDS